MKTWLTILGLTLLATLTTTVSWGQSCSINNWSDGPYPFAYADTLYHVVGQHNFSGAESGGCTYRGTGSTCAAHAGASDTGGASDNGIVTSTCHVPVESQTGGSATSNSGTATAGATAAVAVRHCFGCACWAGLSILSSADGMNTTVSFPSDSIWNVTDNYQLQCAPPGSPIVIDTAGEGFRLTDQPGGVMFDFWGTGSPIKIAWTAADSHNAWLVLDRNGNGKIDDATEMFGSITPQPPSRSKNGYAALAVFDLPENGGNGDGVIDQKDAVFSKLRLWIDANHDGISQPEELHTLPELGVTSLSLKYERLWKTDDYGNQFRYRAKVNPEGQLTGDSVDRVSYDVFLMTHPSDNKLAAIQ